MTSIRTKIRTASIASLAIASMIATSALAASPAGALTHAAEAKRAPVIFNAAAWGTTVKTNPKIAGSGKTALASLGCTRKTGLDRTNESAGVDLPDIGTVGVITSEATTTHSGGAYIAQGDSTVADASLLGGDIQIEGIETVARASKDSDGFHAHVTTTIASLTIGGTPVELTGPEQVIDIPGVAKLTIAHEETTRRSDHSSALGTAITLEILSTGAIVKIGNATASVDNRQIDALFAGGAYTSLVMVGGEVTAGKTAVKHMPCIGTFGEDRSNSTLAGDLGDIGTIGVTTSTVNATATPLPDATVTAEVADAAIEVVGVATIMITGVKAQAHASEDAGGAVTTDIGSSTVGSIQVVPIVGPVIDIPIPVDPNTVITLPLDLGTIAFMTTSDFHHGRGIHVVGLQLHLPMINSDVTLASAKVAIKR